MALVNHKFSCVDSWASAQKVWAEVVLFTLVMDLHAPWGSANTASFAEQTLLDYVSNPPKSCIYQLFDVL